MLDLSSLPPWIIEAGDFVIGCGFLLGFILMNVPQHYLCWKYRSAEGLSLAYILICTISNVTITLASLMGDYHFIIATATNTTGSSSSNSTGDDFNLGDFNTTSMSTGDIAVLMASATNSHPHHPHGDEDWSIALLRLFATLNACMPTLQNFVSILVGVPSLIFYYFLFSTPQPYRPSSEEEDQTATQQPLLGLEASPSTSFTMDDNNNNNDEEAVASQDAIITRKYYYSDGTEFHMAKIATVVTWIICAVAAVISFGVLANEDSDKEENTLLQVWGSTAAITNMILYIPQIVTTWRHQHEGVLSMASLVISVVGDLALVAFWIVASGETVWVYAAGVADAGMQLILIGMIIDFRKKRARERADAQGDYDFVYDATDDEDDYRYDYSLTTKNNNTNKGGEIEVVYGEVLEIYASTTSALESLWETQTLPTTTTHGSMDQSSREFLI
ncbi:expressed unknown protein [Seminavis robusta]|uniref:Uncharacterized protein n=1 Tax=Seminavis robusta TaxID=568900 RepID=A0A9N8DV31_9STRA|nr:expressed unknown protein [Seminavis robusta]|eukprot:Sro364_g127230.1 n/a (446) ;mRNA; r:61080-62417